MNKVHILDCTLRDGGYCNQWNFGNQNIVKIIQGLTNANIEIIECGFITNKNSYDRDRTKFNTVDQIDDIIPETDKDVLFVAMMNYGEYDLDNLPEASLTKVDGIRVAFHKKNMNEALELCRGIKSKGYKVFVQAMVSMSYSDEEFLDLIQKANDIEPYAFYIVDSFGTMKNKELISRYYMVENNMMKNIWIGFHSHNNLQLAYSNALSLLDTKTNRNLIIDASVHGMGRGAGNLNTELFVEYLNENIEARYNIKPLLNIIDEIIDSFYQKNYWGYSLPNYLSAIHNAHPNYAGYLNDKKTLTVEDMDEIFSMMTSEKKYEYDREYIEELYLRYMNNDKINSAEQRNIVEDLSGKEVLLIAPGRSSVDEKTKIIELASKDNVIVVSINADYEFYSPDYIFVSNIRRFKEIDEMLHNKCIVTSNIHEEDIFAKIQYEDLINDIETVKDNAGMMAIKFLYLQGCKKIYLAGFDGYSHDTNENYASEKLEIVTKNDVLDYMNVGIRNALNEFEKKLDIEFVTTRKNI